MNSQAATSVGNRAKLAERIARVQERIGAAARRAGRDPSDVTLVAVTKTFPADVVRQAIACGLTVFGENRVQEARTKIPQVGRQGVSWHLVGPLQRNKVKYCFDLFDLIHSVDSLALAQEIDRRAAARDAVMEVLLEVNVAGEEAKHGVAPDKALALAQAVSKLRGLKVKGLMTMPPWVADPEQSRAHFGELRRIAEDIARAGIEGVEMGELSMGMSADFEVAVEEGATLVRIGAAIFGPREEEP